MDKQELIDKLKERESDMIKYGMNIQCITSDELLRIGYNRIDPQDYIRDEFIMPEENVLDTKSITDLVITQLNKEEIACQYIPYLNEQQIIDLAQIESEMTIKETEEFKPRAKKDQFGYVKRKHRR